MLTAADMQKRLLALEARVQGLEDRAAIEKLTRCYGYYLDKALWQEVLPLFTDDCRIEIGELGIYVGREGAERLYRGVLGEGPARGDERGLAPGLLFNHQLLQGVVDLDANADSASGRWRVFMQLAEFGKSAAWGEGVCNFSYRKQEGRWRICGLHFYRTFQTPFDESWITARSWVGGPHPIHAPDLPGSEHVESFPGAYVPPFHYRNPVTDR